MIYQPFCIQESSDYWSTSIWNSVSMKKKYNERVYEVSTVWHQIVFCWLIDSIWYLPTNKLYSPSVLRTFSEMAMSIKTVHLSNTPFKNPPHWIVFIDSWSNTKTPELSWGEVYMHEKSNKNQIWGRNKSYENGIVVYLHFLLNLYSHWVD